MFLAHLPGGAHLTYCTNIHAGETWPEIRASLGAHLPKIRSLVAGGGMMGVGLRLSGIAADELVAADTLEEFSAFLARKRLYVFTINAFPYGPFHGTRVKEEVYQPDWVSPVRLAFTNTCADILATLLPDGVFGSISTVPGTFKPLAQRPGVAETIAELLIRHAAHLVKIERGTGKHIALAIEPEPYCFLETADEAVAFFERALFARASIGRLSTLTGLNAAQAQERAERENLGRHRRHLASSSRTKPSSRTMAWIFEPNFRCFGKTSQV